MITAYALTQHIVDKFFKNIANASKYGGLVPRDHGVLQDNSINAEDIDGRSARILIGGEKSQGIAYYAIYLQFSEYVGRSTTARNRHREWVTRILKEQVKPYLENEFKGL